MSELINALQHLRAAGLGNEALIEIMLAILGLMVAILGIIATVFSFGLALVAVFGYQGIKEEARRAAQSAAESTATQIANAKAQEILADIPKREQAARLSESQAEEGGASAPPAVPAQRNRKKATSDQGLNK